MAWTFERSDTTVEVWRLLVFKSGHVAGRILHGPDGVCIAFTRVVEVLARACFSSRTCKTATLRS